MMRPSTYNLLHMINLAQKRKHLSISATVYSHDLRLLVLLQRLGYLYFFVQHKLNNPKAYLVKIYVIYSSHSWLLLSRLAKSRSTIFISRRALSLLATRIGISLLILATQGGLMTHREALLQNRGGYALFFLQ